MDNPFGPPSKRKGHSPPPKNNFQQELHAKMYQRKKQGLTTDVTPSESGQESEDELGSDNELMAGFNISTKSRSPGRKSPYDMNGFGSGHKQSKTDLIFGKKHGGYYDEDDDAPNDLLMTMKKPMVMSGKGSLGKKQTQQRQKSPLSFREEDEVDADMSSMPRYMQEPQKKRWEPPSFQKSPALEQEYDHEQLQRDLHKTKTRPKSPRPGRKTPSDLDSITEERERDLDVMGDLSPKLGSGRQYGQTNKPTPKPRDTKQGKFASKSPTPERRTKAPSPTTDIFGSSSKQKSKSPFEKDSLEKEDFKSFMKNKDKKEKEKKEPKEREKSRSPALLDLMAGGSKKDTKSGKKDTKGSKQDKSKHLSGQNSDSDDSIGGEFKRKDEIGRRKSYGKEDPLGRFSPDRHRGESSPYSKDRFSPFDPKHRKSPLDQDTRNPLDSSSKHSPHDKRGYGSPFDKSFDKKGSQFDKHRKSPYYDEREDERGSPLPIKEDRKLYDRQSPKDRSNYDKQKKQSDRDKSPNTKKENPFAKKSSLERDDRERSMERDKYGDREGRYGNKDDRYGNKDDRYGDRDNRYGDKDNRYGDKDNRYGDRDQTDFKKKYGDSQKDRYGYDEPRKEQYNGHGDPREDRLGRKSPFSREYEDSRKSPFEQRDDRRGFDDMDRGFGRDKHVGFEHDTRGPPSLGKGKYDKDRRSPFDRHQEEYADRKPSLRGNEREEYDKYSRQQFEGSRAGERGRSHTRGKKDNDRESSLCREVEADPSSMKKAPTQEEETLKKHKVKSHTKQSALLDQVIESVKEEQTKFKPVDPDKREDKTEGKQRSQSARHRPKPRYVKPVVESFPSRPSSANVDLNNTHSIRDAVFMDWYKDRNEKARKQKEEKLKLEKEEADKKKKAEEDKKLEAMASYNAWAEKKKDFLEEQQKKKRQEERKKHKEEKEKDERKGDAEKSFRLWKEDKDAVLHGKERQKQREEQRKQQEEEEVKYQKQKDAKSAYKSWNEKKEVVIKENDYVKRQDVAKKQREERREKEYREKEASRSYNKWMQKKEKDTKNQAKEERQTRKSMKTRRLEEMNETRPAWSPASRTIPFGS